MVKQIAPGSQDDEENRLQFRREKGAKLNELTHIGPRGIARVCTACSCGFIIRYAGTVARCLSKLEFGVYVVHVVLLGDAG